MKTYLNRHIIFLVLFFVISNAQFAQVPYVPTPYEVVEGMLEMADVKENDLVYDLGCGDGRIVVTAAKKYGARGVGVDNNQTRIDESNENAKASGVTSKVEFHNQNLFETDLTEASVVTLYLLSEINLKLRPKLFKELKPGTRIVSHSFDMDDWEPDSQKNINGRTIYYWKMPANFSGTWTWSDGKGKDTNKLNLTQEFQVLTGVFESGGTKHRLEYSKVNGNEAELKFQENGKLNRVVLESPSGKENNEIIIRLMKGDTNKEYKAKRVSGSMKMLDPEMMTKEK